MKNEENILLLAKVVEDNIMVEAHLEGSQLHDICVFLSQNENIRLTLYASILAIAKSRNELPALYDYILKEKTKLPIKSEKFAN